VVLAWAVVAAAFGADWETATCDPATAHSCGSIVTLDGDAAGGDVVAAEGGDEAVELVEPAGALAVGGEVDGAAVDAGFDAPFGVGDEGQLPPPSADDRVCDRCPPAIRNALMNPQFLK
jgi:hypothetical protein